MKRHLGHLALAALALHGCGPSPVMATYEGTDRVDGFRQVDFERLYRIHVPERVALGPAAPLVLAFHGSSQTGEQMQARYGLDQAADEAGFIVVYLEAAMGAWDIFGSLEFLGLDDIAYVREVIDRVDREYVVDRNRVIAVGISNGGVFSQRLGCKLSDEIAGFVAVSASLPRPVAADCTPSRPVSALYLLGTADTFFPATGGSVLFPIDSTVRFWARLNGCESRRVTAPVLDADADDGTAVYRSRYYGCRGGAYVALDSIAGGGHVWPGNPSSTSSAFGPISREISANAEIIRFLETLPRERD